MQISHKELDVHLNKPLLPVYLICSDVPLLMQEARDSIRKAAWQQGFQQRELFFIDEERSWEALDIAIDNFNLFSEKILIEIRNSQAKFNERGMQILLKYLKNPPSDKRLLICTNKLTTVQKKSRWYKEISTLGVVVSIHPIPIRELQKWIVQRLKKFNISVDTESINLLATFTEGNLLATQQAIEKFRLLCHQNKPLRYTVVNAVIGDNAYFTIFDLAEAVLLGDKTRVIRILSVLQFVDKESSSLVLWVLTRELRNIYTSLQKSVDGKSFEQLLAFRWKGPYKKLIKIALARLDSQIVSELLRFSKRVDWIIKGVIPGNAWQELETLSLSIAGAELR
ncbi:DNA polymerase III subunit delta [Coxiella endosymbiont of Amblyomma sculptum]|uniref:DNA polymerase III subunit delta n=1 Tax=Coxiella endosymbiont of Amblyomma sculptum TaxID=2487929 RepID=UPI00132EF05D|nr:DNA polymerase III subunit delta [Coxiella endosymbiont of Amblyomma sculptum]QHG92624.1 DNA polymerase III subunit delta [Coxiella endosymbiont of Amblyomma sculptum]